MEGVRQPWRSSHVLIVIPILLIVAITAVDMLVPADIHLGPLLVVAPAITASFAGPWLTGLIGLLAVLAQAYIGLHFGVLFSERNVMVQVLSLAVLSAMIVFFCKVRERRRRELARVRSVSEAAQQALLRPLPRRIGGLELASFYVAADEEAEIGGDLFTATRTDGGVRVLIGDVRGKGLTAIGESALLLGAFREAADKHRGLPALAAALDHSVSRYLTDFMEDDGDLAEHFITALLLEIPDDGLTARMTNCGHPPPILLGRNGVVSVSGPRPGPPLGMLAMGRGGHTADTFGFEPGDTLLLYTDGVTEARDRRGVFYPFKERAAQWSRCGPETLLRHVRRDLLHHCGGRLGDDAAIVAIQRAPVPQHGHHLGHLLHA
ncbi:PP2C family protein-serine/threonine phosphatase [Streptomyces sp. NPDC002004]